MNSIISQAELPLNSRGAVYHLDLLPEELADTIITVGDPERVEQISKHFDLIEVKRVHREFLTHTGRLGNQRLSIVSTGIGVDNIDIVLNELDAVANIDLKTREIKSQIKSLSIIRLGTTGGLISDCSPGEVVCSRYAVGFDTMTDYYQYALTPDLLELEGQLRKHLLNTDGHLYATESCPKLFDKFSSIGMGGITATCIGFYGPQGRQLRLALKYPDWLDQLACFNFKEYRMMNLEMETAALYALGSMMGHRCLSLSVVIANRAKGTFIENVPECIETFIENTLDKISTL